MRAFFTQYGAAEDGRATAAPVGARMAPDAAQPHTRSAVQFPGKGHENSPKPAQSVSRQASWHRGAQLRRPFATEWNAIPMRLSRALMTGLVVALCSGGIAGLASGPAAAAGESRYASAQVAFDQGLGAYKAGYYEIAIPALLEAAERGGDRERFFARFYLARIFSDNGAATTDHARAYRLFEEIVTQSNDVEPDDGRRAPFVAKAMIALAGYLRTGLQQIGLKSDVERANDLLQDAASIYNDKDAQFELAKVQLAPEATPEDIRLGVHYLSVLTNHGHPGAQAYLADLYWRGRFVQRDERRALALVKLALRNAPLQERVWIEDIYQNIYCGASQGVRRQADGTVAAWNKVFPRPSAAAEEMAAVKVPPMERYCKSGEQVDLGEEVAGSHTIGPIQASPAPPVATGPRPASGPSVAPADSSFSVIGAGVKQ